MRTPDLKGGTGGFDRPTVNHLARAATVAHRARTGRTVIALLVR
ncbi:hypothetical protein [Streptomyces sp. SAS_276]